VIINIAIDPLCVVDPRVRPDGERCSVDFGLFFASVPSPNRAACTADLSLVIVALAAPWISPFDPTRQSRAPSQAAVHQLVWHR